MAYLHHHRRRHQEQQTIRFLGRRASLWRHLRGWVFLYTITLAHLVTDEQRGLHRELSGPRYPKFEMGSDEWKKRIEHSNATMPQGLHHDLTQKLRQIGGEKGGNMTVVQDAVFYKRWLSKEEEETLKTAIPGVKVDWDDELRKIGAIEAKEEDTDLSRIGLGLY